jgi:hypothetical protein
VAAGIVSFVFYATALEGGSVTVATAAVVLAETLPPALIGVAFLGDKTRPGLEPAAIAGFVVAVFSAVILARFGEAHDVGQAHDAGQDGRAHGVDQTHGVDRAQASDQAQAGNQAQAGDQARAPGGQAKAPHFPEDAGDLPGRCQVT